MNKLLNNSINETLLEINEDGFEIATPEKSDFFNSPVIIDDKINITNSAPFYYKDVTGDFTIRVQVRNNFTHDYDAGAIFIHETDLKWIKLAFEKTDFNTNSIVSVITDETSDDANGANLDSEWIWLMVSRKDNTFALHYSLDGIEYTLVRIFRLVMTKTIKVGLTAQSPIGPIGKRYFKDLSISDYILSDLRAGTIKSI